MKSSLKGRAPATRSRRRRHCFSILSVRVTVLRLEPRLLCQRRQEQDKRGERVRHQHPLRIGGDDHTREHAEVAQIFRIARDAIKGPGPTRRLDGTPFSDGPGAADLRYSLVSRGRQNRIWCLNSQASHECSRWISEHLMPGTSVIRRASGPPRISEHLMPGASVIRRASAPPQSQAFGAVISRVSPLNSTVSM